MTQAIYSLLWVSRLEATSSAASDKMCSVQNRPLYAKYFMQVSREIPLAVNYRLRSIVCVKTILFNQPFCHTDSLCSEEISEDTMCLGTSKHLESVLVHMTQTLVYMLIKQQLMQSKWRQHVYSSTLSSACFVAGPWFKIDACL